jgi:hypothetical protein
VRKEGVSCSWRCGHSRASWLSRHPDLMPTLAGEDVDADGDGLGSSASCGGSFRVRWKWRRCAERDPRGLAPGPTAHPCQPVTSPKGTGRAKPYWRVFADPVVDKGPRRTPVRRGRDAVARPGCFDGGSAIRMKNMFQRPLSIRGLLLGLMGVATGVRVFPQGQSGAGGCTWFGATGRQVATASPGL